MKNAASTRPTVIRKGTNTLSSLWLAGHSGDELGAGHSVADSRADRSAGHHDSASGERAGGDDDDGTNKFWVCGHDVPPQMVDWSSRKSTVANTAAR